MTENKKMDSRWSLSRIHCEAGTTKRRFGNDGAGGVIPDR